MMADRCLVCGAPIEQPRTGRPRRFCGGACRVRDHRMMKRWAHEAVGAALASQPEPHKWWRDGETRVHRRCSETPVIRDRG